MTAAPSPSRPELLRAMRASPLFCALRPGPLELVALRGQLRGYAAGEAVFQAGEPADRFFLVVRGRVKVFKLSERGGEQILHCFGPGITFGEAAMWAGGRYPAYSEAVERSVLFVLSRSALREALAGNPDLAIGMMAGLSQKLREFVQLVEDLSLKEVPARLAGALLREAKAAGGEKFRMRQTKAELASRLGTIPATLSRGLRKFRDAGIIRVSGPVISILKPAELRRLAGGD
ncbi:MAG: Crp/Fnr family transcriptional regulator [Elusimicrobia bacterium]|nr:Crp/Fnr family transcriptional regulator [Elusimicrobiota bacterium]